MKHLITILFLVTCFQVFGQNNPGFSYQAIIRNEDGKALKRSKVDIVVDLYSDDVTNALFSESHQTKTDKFGQINIVIGQGTNLSGNLQDIPWEDGNIFYSIRITNESKKLDIISEAQLLAVPYALHANTANSIKGDEADGNGRNGTRKDFWSLAGNELIGINSLGSTNEVELNIVTNDEIRIHISENGPISIKEDVTAESKASFLDIADFAEDVYFQDFVKMKEDVLFQDNVKMDEHLEVGQTLHVKGEGEFELSLVTEENLTVYGTSELKEELTVGGDTRLNENLQVDGNSNLSQDLTVNGDAVFNGGFQVAGEVLLGSDLTVLGRTQMNDILSVEKDVADGQYVASFTNTNTGNGDGINIKLGKDRTIFTPPTVPSLLTPEQVQDIKNLISCDFTGNKVSLLGDIVLEGILNDVEMVASLAVGTGNLFIGFLNNKLSLPIKLPDVEVVPKVPVFPGFDWSVNLPLDIGTIGFSIPEESIGPYKLPTPTLVPAVPTIDLGFLGVGEIPVNDLDFWGIPNICLSDAPGSSPLNNENEFIRFSDASDNKMGSIRAVSLTDWSNNYLTPSYLFKLHGAITSAVDKKHARYHFKGELSQALEDYKSIGVEYSSGNGDYAEWLERVELEEHIAPGDIVGVIGGKITRDVSKAEQVMVVSHSPIVLGNVPPAGDNHKGNNIAFMGQVPVKVMGPVNTGDYIVASQEIPGYGIAKSQDEMSIEDFKNAVGRSWDSDDSAGPKLINTVVGIHNGDYSKLLLKIDEKLNQSEKRFETLEYKVEALSKILTQ